MNEWQIAAESLVAGLFASLALVLGVLPVAFGKRGLQRRIGLTTGNAHHRRRDHRRR